MKVELNIEAGQMGETVIELFQHLTVPQKQQIAGDMVRQWLNLPYGAEREIKERQVWEKLRKEHPNERDYESFERARNEYRFKNEMERFKSTREQFLADVTKEVVIQVREEITKQIQSDPEIKRILDVTLEGIKRDFPKFVHDAMTAYFCTQMQTMSQGLMVALQQSGAAVDIADQVRKKVQGY